MEINNLKVNDDFVRKVLKQDLRWTYRLVRGVNQKVNAERALVLR